MFDVSFQGRKYQRTQRRSSPAAPTCSIACERFRGVTAVGATSTFPLRGTQENSLFVQLRGRGASILRSPMSSRQRFVSPGFFDAMGIRMLAGRDFTTDDRQGTTPVADRQPDLRRPLSRGQGSDRRAVLVRLSDSRTRRNEVTIIGVVEDVRQKSLERGREPAFYTSLTPVYAAPAQAVVVATHAERSDAAAVSDPRRGAQVRPADRGRLRVRAGHRRHDPAAAGARDDVDAALRRRGGRARRGRDLRRHRLRGGAAHGRSRDATGARRHAASVSSGWC